MNISKLHRSSHRSLSMTLLAMIALILLGAHQAQAQWATNGNNINNTNTGNVGVGTTTPGTKLEVAGSIWSRAASVELDLMSTTGGAGSFGIGTGWATVGAGKLYVYDNVNAATRLVIDSTGNIGIGTLTPAAKLDVQGNINVSGNINAKFQDVAEWVSASHTLSPGTVVVLNPYKVNEVTASTSAYDTRVAGVVSERPGLALGEAGQNKVLVATTGRVKVKVDATRSPIHVGDLLVTGDVEGVAMKSEPVDLGGVKLHRPGTLIGKALEPLEKGTGEILVLLSLQ